MKYRKKPVVIDAFHFTNHREIAFLEWVGGDSDKLCIHWDANSKPDGITISTPEGTMLAQPGDWIVRGVQGELYPVKPDIFEVTYEAVQ